MDIKEKRIVVTGAAGFIGSNLTDRVLEIGSEVVGVDNLFNGRLENLDEVFKHDNFKFHKGNIRDLNFLLDVFEDIDIVYHLTAFMSVPQSKKMPENYNNVNINGALNVLNAARRMRVEKIIYASISSVYGDTPILPKRKDMRRLPISPYGVAKLFCEANMQV